MSNDSCEGCDREALRSDLVDALKREYNIDEQAISFREISGDVILSVEDVPADFPGFGSSEVDVIGMSDEIKYGYVPRNEGSIRIYTERPTAPDWE